MAVEIKCTYEPLTPTPSDSQQITKVHQMPFILVYGAKYEKHNNSVIVKGVVES